MPLVLAFNAIDTSDNHRIDVVFDRSPVRIGRNQLNDLCLAPAYVSQFHAMVELCDGRIVARDLGSLNGTSFSGQRLTRNEPVDVTNSPEIRIGYIVVQMAAIEAPRAVVKSDDGLFGPTGTTVIRPVGPPQRRESEADELLVHQIGPRLEACRTNLREASRIIHEHLERLPSELRADCLDRVAVAYPPIVLDAEFQRVARQHGIDPRVVGEPSAAATALAELTALVQTLAPSSRPPVDAAGVLALVQRLRDTLDVFFKCVCCLRDGHEEFEKSVLSLDRESSRDTPVARARDAEELGAVLLGSDAAPEAQRQVRDIFVTAMTHQIALLGGIGDGIRALLYKLSPGVLARERDAGQRRKPRLFASRHEDLWQLYARRHEDYATDDKQVWQDVFGPEFRKTYKSFR